ncbi:sugar phosphate isomerase/epimerase family protein [Enterococcus sp. LJL51]|uniref:sugar phosphate isomerase/epimerase family protein n=1 Tax=Enterococcus sp. LJL51 TaxID=3416656 RepID=UPI003CEA0027
MIPLNLGIRAHDLSADSREELADKVLKHDLSHIQLAVKKSFPEFAPDLRSISSGTASFISDYLQRMGIKISVLGCYINMASPDPQFRRRELDIFKHHITLANDYHAAVVGTETGSVGDGYTTKNFTEEAYQLARDSVIELTAFAEKFGVTVGVEAGINHPLHTSELALRLIKEVQSPNLKIIMDCANLISVENHQQQEAVVYNALNQLRDDIASFHLKDFIIENNQVKIVPVGTGWMNYDQILSFLKHDKPLMFASLEATVEPHVASAAAKLRDIYQALPD